MDRRERLEDPLITQMAAMRGWQLKMWTAIPAVISSFSAANMTVEAQPTIMARVFSIDGNAPLPGASPDRDGWWWVPLPLLVDVPVCFPSAGGFTMTFPVAAGDEALIVFASRCIDAWWTSSRISVQAELRMHDLSDGFAIVGPHSKPRAISGISSNSVQLRSDDGSCFVEVKSGHIVNVTAPGGINLTGNVVVTGTVTANGKRIDETHIHSGVTAGASTTGVVV